MNKYEISLGRSMCIVAADALVFDEKTCHKILYRGENIVAVASAEATVLLYETGEEWSKIFKIKPSFKEQ